MRVINLVKISNLRERYALSRLLRKEVRQGLSYSEVVAFITVFVRFTSKLS